MSGGLGLHRTGTGQAGELGAAWRDGCWGCQEGWGLSGGMGAEGVRRAGGPGHPAGHLLQPHTGQVQSPQPLQERAVRLQPWVRPFRPETLTQRLHVGPKAACSACTNSSSSHQHPTVCSDSQAASRLDQARAEGPSDTGACSVSLLLWPVPVGGEAATRSLGNQSPSHSSTYPAHDMAAALAEPWTSSCPAPGLQGTRGRAGSAAFTWDHACSNRG